jgi:thioredoxin-like negative regulator of GroEL
MRYRIRISAVHICAWILCAVFGLAAPAASPEIVWLHSLSEAVKQASAEGKLIIVDLVADWCGWCRLMEKETWAQPAVAELSGKHVFLKLDIDKDADGTGLARRFKVSGLPMLLLLTAKGDEFERLQGFLPAQEFLEKLKAALADPDSPGNMRLAHLKDPRNIELHFKLAYELFGRGDYQESEEHFSQIVRQDPGNQSKRADASMFYLAVCKASRSDLEGCLALLDRLRKELPGSNVVPGSYLLAGQALLRAGKRAEARMQVEEFLRRYPTHPLVPKAKELLAQIGNE